MKRQHESTSVFSVEALAIELGISRHSAYVGLRNGTIPSIRLGRRFIVPKIAITKWLESAGRNSAAVSDDPRVKSERFDK